MSIAYWITTLGGSGLAKRAPGTIGSMVSLLFWTPFLFLETSWWVRPATACFVFYVGLWAIRKSLTQFKGSDPQAIVIDEATGMGITLCFCQPSWLNLIVGFALFRFFDVLKPWPVNWADREIKGPLGIMLDDVLAGIYALMMLFVFEKWVLPLLGSFS